MTVKYCTNCGAKTSSGAKFCYECGKILEQTKQKKEQEKIIQTTELQTLVNDSKEKGWRQLTAIKEMGESQNPEAVLPLISLLSWKQTNRERKRGHIDRFRELTYEEQLESYNVRWAAVDSLIKLGTISVEPLINVIESDFEGISAEMIENNKGRYEKKPVPDVDGEKFVKNHAVYTLGEIADNRVIDTLYNCMMYADYPLDGWNYREIVYSPYRTTDTKIAMNSLIKCGNASDEALTKVIQCFIRTLNNLKQGLLLNDDGSLDHESGHIYNDRLENSASALAYIGQPSVEPLIELYNKKPELEKEIISILGHIKGKTVFDLIIKRLSLPKGDDENPEDWKWVDSNRETYSLIRDIIKGYESEGNDYLIEALNSEDSNIRLGAARGMGLIGHPSFVNPLTAATSDKDSNVAFAALGALRRTTGNLEKLPEFNNWWLNLEIIMDHREKPPIDRRGQIS